MTEEERKKRKKHSRGGRVSYGVYGGLGLWNDANHDGIPDHLQQDQFDGVSAEEAVGGPIGGDGSMGAGSGGGAV